MSFLVHLGAWLATVNCDSCGSFCRRDYCRGHRTTRESDTGKIRNVSGHLLSRMCLKPINLKSWQTWPHKISAAPINFQNSSTDKQKEKQKIRSNFLKTINLAIWCLETLRGLISYGKGKDYTSQKAKWQTIFRKHIIQLSGLEAESYGVSLPNGHTICQMATVLRNKVTTDPPGYKSWLPPQWWFWGDGGGTPAKQARSSPRTTHLACWGHTALIS